MGRHLPFVFPSFAHATAMDNTTHAHEDHDAPPRLSRFRAGRPADNPVPGRVLKKSGFRYTGSDGQWCEARRHGVVCLFTEAHANGADRR